MSGEPINIQLNHDEAVVLFEFLSRYSKEDRLSIEDQAEQRVLWNLCCDLEKLVSIQFSENYGQILEKARTKIRDASEQEYE